MKNTIVFLSVVIAAVLTWFGYALLASLITDVSLNNCMSDDTVITFLFFTGWILPSLVGFDLYRYIHRHETRRERRIDREIREIKGNTFGSGIRHMHGSLPEQYHLN